MMCLASVYSEIPAFEHGPLLLVAGALAHCVGGVLRVRSGVERVGSFLSLIVVIWLASTQRQVWLYSVGDILILLGLQIVLTLLVTIIYKSRQTSEAESRGQK